MRSILWLGLAALGACSGGGNSDSGTGSSAGDDDDAQLIDCNALPQYDIAGKDCDELGIAFADEVDAATACTKNEDCRTIHPACEHWDSVFCYYAVNTCFTQEKLNAYGAESEGCAVVDGVRVNACECPAAPVSECINNKCQMVIEPPQ
ncbi:MAG: hypothetical protein ABMA64_10095 [Myxococcota bacterium]|jgi:hypothetical protein